MRVDLAETRRPDELLAARRRGAVRLLILADDITLLSAPRLAAAEAVQDSGYEVHLAVLHDERRSRPEGLPIKTAIDAAGLSLQEIPAPQRSGRLFRGLKLVGHYDALVETLRPDLIHCIGPRSAVCAGPVARLRGIPAVLSLPARGAEPLALGVETGLPELLAKLGLSFAAGHARTAVVVQNAEDRSRLGAAARRAFLLRGAAVDLAVFRPRAADEREPGPAVVMLAPSRLEPEAVSRFAEAQALLNGRGVRARFVILGARHPEAPDASLEWWDEAADRPSSLRQADIFCAIGTRMAGLPETLVETLASGLPVVAGDVPPLRQAVRHGLNGLIVPPGEVPALANAVERMIGDWTFLTHAGKRSREIAEAEFSLSAFLTASLAVYRAALEKAPAGPAGPSFIESPSFIERRRAT